MTGNIERHDHVSITRRTADTVTHTDMHVAETRQGNVTVVSHTTSVTSMTMNSPYTAEPAAAGQPDDHFDPATCCSACEQAMIAALRAYLRPQSAPDDLVARLKATLDRCCAEADGQ